MDEKALRAMLLDRAWIFVLPDASTKETYNANSYLNSVLIHALNDDFKVPTCHAALFDADGSCNPGMFIWDPKPQWLDHVTRSGPLIYLTPKDFFIKDKPLLHPDLSTLELFVAKHEINKSMKIRDDGAIAISRTKPPDGSLSCYKDGTFRNCFFLIPKPFPKIEILMQRFETLANIRGIDVEEAWTSVAREAKLGRFTPSTQRFRDLLLEVCCLVCPESAVFALQYLDAEGNRV